MITREEIIEYLKKINGLKEGISSYAYEDDGLIRENIKIKCLVFAIDDYDFYFSNNIELNSIIDEVRKKHQHVCVMYRPLNDKMKILLKDKIIKI